MSVLDIDACVQKPVNLFQRLEALLDRGPVKSRARFLQSLTAQNAVICSEAVHMPDNNERHTFSVYALGWLRGPTIDGRLLRPLELCKDV